MTSREPSAEAILAARLQRAYPSLSPYSSASLAQQLGAIERMQRMHATRQCNGPRDVRRKPERGEVFGYCKAVPLPATQSVNPTAPRGMTWTDDVVAEERAGKRIERAVHAWNKSLAERHGLAWTMQEHTHGNWRCTLQDGKAHQTVVAEWTIGTEGDPRGAVLKVRLPGEPEAVSV